MLHSWRFCMTILTGHDIQPMKKTTTTFSWGDMLDELLAAGVTTPEIGKAMGFCLTLRMLSAYRTGSQPAHWRGEGLIELWCKITGKQREQAPTISGMEHLRVRGPSVKKEPEIIIPVWPQPKKRGRPRKVVVA